MITRRSFIARALTAVGLGFLVEKYVPPEPLWTCPTGCTAHAIQPVHPPGKRVYFQGIDWCKEGESIVSDGFLIILDSGDKNERI